MDKPWSAGNGPPSQVTSGGQALGEGKLSCDERIERAEVERILNERGVPLDVVRTEEASGRSKP